MNYYKVDFNVQDEQDSFVYLEFASLTTALAKQGISIPANEETFYTEENKAYLLSKGISVERVSAIPQTLEQIKAEKIADFKERRNAEETSLLEYDGNIFDVDKEFSLPRIQVAMAAIEGTDTTISWTTADNNTVSMTYTDFSNLLKAMAYRSDLLHIKYRQLKEQIGACTTVEQVQAICWTESGEA